MASLVLHLNAWKRRGKIAAKEKKRVTISDNTLVYTVSPRCSQNLSRNDASGADLNPENISKPHTDKQETHRKKRKRSRERGKASQQEAVTTRGYLPPISRLRSDKAHAMNALVVRKQSETAHSDGDSRPSSPTSSKRTNAQNTKAPTKCYSEADAVTPAHDPELGVFEDAEPNEEEKPDRWRRYWKRATQIISSQLGLLVALVIYAFLGAAIFQAIEGPHEKDQKHDLQKIRDKLIQDAWNLIHNSPDNSTFREFSRALDEELYAYDRVAKKAFEHGIMAGNDTKIWDYWGSLFFSTTVFTTVGYGHIAPATSEGRVVTMLYATIGVPLFFVVMANLGRLLTRFIKYLWSYVRRLYYTKTFRRVRKSFLRSVRSRFSQKQATDNNTTSPETRKPSEELTDTDSYVDYQVDDHFNLHPLVAITITVLYIFFGALVYVQWERWTYLEAFYFIFVSVSTIGFGDLVPEHPKYFLASSIYILLGLSLVAMVINVIMEFFSNTLSKAKEKVENISRSIGLDMDKIDSVSSKRKHTSPPCPSKPSVKVKAANDSSNSSRELGEVNRAFSHRDINETTINNNDICKDSGYAENTESTCSSDSDSSESVEPPTNDLHTGRQTHKRSTYKTSVIMSMPPTENPSHAHERSSERGNSRTTGAIVHYHDNTRANSHTGHCDEPRESQK